jgi:AcrR family transcriptional regulator
VAGTPVGKLTPERRRALTRAALLEAAREVFARRGFNGASLDEIAETAGFTRGAIYKHFENKEDMLFAVYDQMNEEALERISQHLELGPAAAFDFSAVADMWREIFGGDPELVALELEFQLYELRNPSVQARAAVHRQRNIDRIADFISEQASKLGLIVKAPPSILAAIFLAASTGPVVHSRLNPGEPDLYKPFLELIAPAMLEERSTPARTRAPKPQR